MDEQNLEFQAQEKAAPVIPETDTPIVTPTAQRRKRRKSKKQIFKEKYLPFIILGVSGLLCLSFIFGSISLRRERDAAKAKNDRITQLLQDEAASLKSRAAAMAAEYESYEVGYLASREAVDRVVVRGSSVEVQSPRSVAIAELELGDCGRLVRVDGVHLVSTTSVDTQEGDVMEDARWRGYALFKNDMGDSIAVYTRDYARFAEDAIPLVDVSLSGVVEWARYNGGRECYQLKMRYEEDCTIY